MFSNRTPYILIFLLLIPLLSLGQNEEQDKTKNYRLGITVTPTYNYRILKNEKKNSNRTVSSLRNNLEIPKLGYSAGINYINKINERVNFQIGLHFSDKGEKTKKKN